MGFYGCADMQSPIQKLHEAMESAKTRAKVNLERFEEKIKSPSGLNPRTLLSPSAPAKIVTQDVTFENEKLGLTLRRGVFSGRAVVVEVEAGATADAAGVKPNDEVGQAIPISVRA